MKRIDVLVFKNCIATPALTSFEILNKIDGFRRELRRGQNGSGLKVRLVACSRKSRTITTADGCPVQCHAALGDIRRADLILVPAFDGDVLAQLEENREVVPWLRGQFQKGADVASICTGAFALAEAGLLDGISATTHWAAQGLFRSRYPKVNLKEQQVIVDQGRIITCGGAFSFLNLLIYLAEKLIGHDVAVHASRMLLIDVNKSPQGAYAIFGTQKNHNDPAVLKTQNLIEDAPSEDFSVERLADDAALSRRQFLRRFKLATGNTPVEYIQRVRVEAAKKALMQTRDSLDEISWGVGYSDAPGFRKLFIRYTGLTPTEFRRRYSTVHSPRGDA